MRSKTKNWSSSIPAALLLCYVLQHTVCHWSSSENSYSSFSKEATNSSSAAATSFAAAKWTEEQSSSAVAAFEQNSKHQERDHHLFATLQGFLILCGFDAFIILQQTSVRHRLYHRKRERENNNREWYEVRLFSEAKRSCYKRWENGKMTFPSFFFALLCYISYAKLQRQQAADEGMQYRLLA